MEEKKDNNKTNEVKEIKKAKASIPNIEQELITAYAQLVFHTLQYSGTEISAKSIRSEVRMFYEKFGNQEVKRLADIIMKEKKEKN